MARSPLVVLALSALLLPRPALAQAPDPQKASAAQALFDQAGEEMEAKNFRAACPRLEEAVKLIPEALGARMTLAECYEGLGKLASAWAQYAMVEGLAAKAGQPDRADKAGKRSAGLKPRLATLTLELAGGLDGIQGLHIARDGVDIGKGQAGVGLPVDVGTHDIVVSAPGYKTWKKTLEVLADGAKTTTKVPMLAPDAGGGAGAPTSGDRPWQTPLGIGLLVGGGVSLALGGLFGGLALSKNDESNKVECNAQNKCSPLGLEMRDQAIAFGNASTGLFIGGGLLAAGGVVLLALPSGGGAKGDKKAGVRWGVTPTLGGVLVKGAW